MVHRPRRRPSRDPGSCRDPRPSPLSPYARAIARDPSNRRTSGDHGQPDEDLVAAAKAGDRKAIDTLLRRHHARIWAICRRLAGNDADAADATQEAMVLIVRRLDTFDGRASFSTWSHRVATNACLDELRRRKRRPAPGLPDDEPGGIPTRDRSPGVAGSVADRLTIDDALLGLPDEFRVPIVLRDLCGHDYAEIAELLDIPPGTVRSRIARGRARLADALSLTGTNDAAGNQPTANERPSSRP